MLHMIIQTARSGPVQHRGAVIILIDIIAHSTCFDHSPYKTAEKHIIGS